jgi:hypothetical protein
MAREQKQEPEPVIYHMPEKYLEKQRIIKALLHHDKDYHLAMYFYAPAKTEDPDKLYLWGVYAGEKDNILLCFDKDSFKYLDEGSNPEEVYRFLREFNPVTTEYLGCVFGTCALPPKPEGKIIPFREALSCSA